MFECFHILIVRIHSDEVHTPVYASLERTNQVSELQVMTCLNIKVDQLKLVKQVYQNRKFAT